MNDPASPIARFLGPLVAILAFSCHGCGEELGPVPRRVARVQGVVREGTGPVSSGWIEFFPTHGTLGNLRSARLRADGSFEAEGVAVGENLLRLVNAPIKSAGAAQLFGSYSSPIRRVVPERPAAPLDIDLVDEAIQFRGSRRREAQARSSGSGGPR